MKGRDLLFRRMLAAAALLVAAGAAGPVYAGVGPSDFDAAVPCNAFQRGGNGGWTVTAPVTLNINNGVSLSLMPGQSMGPGSTIGGVAVPVILDRHCGNV
jgi:hypothetical protein